MNIKLQIARDRALSHAELNHAIAAYRRLPQDLRDAAAREARIWRDIVAVYNRMIETLGGAA